MINVLSLLVTDAAGSHALTTGGPERTHSVAMTGLHQTIMTRGATYVANQAAGRQPTQQRNGVRHTTALRKTVLRRTNQHQPIHSSLPGTRALRASRTMTKMIASPSSFKIPRRMRHQRRARTMDNFTAIFS